MSDFIEFAYPLNSNAMNNWVIVKNPSDLALDLITPTWSSIVFGDYFKSCSGFHVIPIAKEDMFEDNTFTEQRLTVNGVEGDVTIYTPSNALTIPMFYCGKFSFVGVTQRFDEYLPYVKYQLYLPFYGFVDINQIDFLGKYLEIFLKCDFITGDCIYVLKSNTYDVNYNRAPFIFPDPPDNYDEGIVIGTYPTNIAYKIPLGYSNTAEVQRNALLGGLKAASSIFTSLASKNITTTVTTTHKDIKKINPDTNRLKKFATIDENVTEQKTSSGRKDIANNIFNSVPQAVNSSSVDVGSMPNNPYLSSFVSNKIHLITRRLKLAKRDGSFYHIYGRPLGETRVLNEVSGFTKIGDAHIEGEYFSTATEDEKIIIKDLLTDGVIL